MRHRRPVSDDDDDDDGKNEERQWEEWEEENNVKISLLFSLFQKSETTDCDFIKTLFFFFHIRRVVRAKRDVLDATKMRAFILHHEHHHIHHIHQFWSSSSQKKKE